MPTSGLSHATGSKGDKSASANGEHKGGPRHEGSSPLSRFAWAVRENLATIVAGIIVAGLFVTSLVAFWPWRSADQSAGGSGLRVVVHEGSGDVRAYPLDEDRTVEIVSSKGRNVIAIEGGAVRMVEADCPNGVCLRQKPLSGPGQQIVCLPHELWVEVVDADDAAGGQDAAGGSGVDFVAG